MLNSTTEHKCKVTIIFQQQMAAGHASRMMLDMVQNTLEALDASKNQMLYN
jgi:hypothetical protein